MKLLVWIWLSLKSLLTYIDNIDNNVVRIIIQYWTIFLTIKVIICILRLIGLGLYKGVSNIANKFKPCKKIILIWWEVELKMFFEMLYRKLKLYKLSGGIPEENVFISSSKYSPSGLLKMARLILKRMVAFDVVNIIIWSLLLVHIFQITTDDIYKFISVTIKSNLLIQLKRTSIKSIVEVLKNISFLTVAILIITGYWSYLSVYRNVYNEKLKKVMQYQDNLINILGGIIYKLEENINTLIKNREILPNLLCELITGEEVYYLKEDKLKRYSFNTYNKLDNKELDDKELDNRLDEFKSYSNEFNRLEEIMGNFESENLWDVFYSVNKVKNIEGNKLGFYNKETLKNRRNDLLDKENIKNWLKNLSENDSLKEEYKNIVKVWKGEICKSDYQKKHIQVAGLTFDEKEKWYEKQLEKKVIDFTNSIDRRLRNSIEVYLTLTKYLNKLIKYKKRLKFFSKVK